MLAKRMIYSFYYTTTLFNHPPLTLFLTLIPFSSLSHNMQHNTAYKTENHFLFFIQCFLFKIIYIGISFFFYFMLKWVVGLENNTKIFHETSALGIFLCTFSMEKQSQHTYTHIHMHT